MKKIFLIIIALAFAFSSVYSAVDYIYFNSKFLKSDSENIDKKVYYETSYNTIHNDFSIKKPEKKYQTTYRDRKREYDLNVYENDLYRTSNLGDKSEVYNYEIKEVVYTQRSQYKNEKSEFHPSRWRDFRTSTDYSNNFFR